MNDGPTNAELIAFGKKSGGGCAWQERELAKRLEAAEAKIAELEDELERTKGHVRDANVGAERWHHIVMARHGDTEKWYPHDRAVGKMTAEWAKARAERDAAIQRAERAEEHEARLVAELESALANLDEQRRQRDILEARVRELETTLSGKTFSPNELDDAHRHLAKAQLRIAELERELEATLQCSERGHDGMWEAQTELDAALARVRELESGHKDIWDSYDKETKLRVAALARIDRLRDEIEDAAGVLESGAEPFCSEVPGQLREALAADDAASKEGYDA